MLLGRENGDRTAARVSTIFPVLNSHLLPCLSPSSPNPRPAAVDPVVKASRWAGAGVDLFFLHRRGASAGSPSGIASLGKLSGTATAGGIQGRPKAMGGGIPSGSARRGTPRGPCSPPSTTTSSSLQGSCAGRSSLDLL